MAMVRGAGALEVRSLTRATDSRRGICAAGIGRAAGAVGERGLEDPLQFGGLGAGELAAGHLARNQVVDLRLQIAGRRICAAGRGARAAALQRGIDIRQCRGKRGLIGRTDGAGVYFRLQFGLQLLQRG